LTNNIMVIAALVALVALAMIAALGIISLDISSILVYIKY
jgi:hypothetical protein